MSEPNETTTLPRGYYACLLSDLVTSRLNASAAVNLAQDRDKECQRLRWENDRLRECVADQEKNLQEARQRIGELERAYSELHASKNRSVNKWVSRLSAAESERDALKAELASVRTGSAQLAADLNACKRERDEMASEALRLKGADALKELAFRKAEQFKQQLTEKSALCERLKEFIRWVKQRPEADFHMMCVAQELLQRAEGKE